MTPYYEHAGITIYHGDCRDVDLPHKSIDLVLTDPPYGQQFSRYGAPVKANIRADGARQGVRIVRSALLWLEPSWKADAHLLVMCHWEGWPDFYDAISPLAPIKNAVIWWKNRGGMGDLTVEYARDYEVILYASIGRRPLNGKRPGAVISGIPPVGKGRLHPTEKPEQLMRQLILRHSPSDGVVVDPFTGSGTTLIAAKNSGRQAIGIEIEERYCEIAAKRLGQEVLAFEDAR